MSDEAVTDGREGFESDDFAEIRFSETPLPRTYSMGFSVTPNPFPLPPFPVRGGPILADSRTSETYKLQVVDENSGRTRRDYDNIAVDLEDLLLCCGLATTTALHIDNTAAWAPILEYQEVFTQPTGKAVGYGETEADHLRVIPGHTYWDPSEKSRFSERMGLAFCAWWLWNRDKIAFIADAYQFLDRVGFDGTPFEGTRLIQHSDEFPDLLCLTENEELVIVESKGAVGPPSSVPTSGARAQVRAVTPSSSGPSLRQDAAGIIAKSRVRRAPQRVKKGKDSGLEIETMDSQSLTPSEYSLPRGTGDEIALSQYHRFLSLCGYSVPASSVNERNFPLPISDELQNLLPHAEFLERGIYPLARFGRRELLGLIPNVADLLFSDELSSWAPIGADRVDRLPGRIIQLVEEYRSERTPAKNLNIFPNGIVVDSRDEGD